MYDYVIVGAGSAGCVLASRLTEDPNVHVLLLEAGPPDASQNIHVPLGFTRNFRTQFDWDLATHPEPRLQRRRIYLPRGRTLGGSSSINAMIYIRGNRADYDGWGCEGWAFDDLLAYFKRAEDNERGADEWHGAGGPLQVCDGRSRNPIAAAFIEAGVQAGLARNEDFNGAEQDGVGWYQCTQRNGWRCSTAVAYLHPAMSRPNLVVRTGAQVHRVTFDDALRATGVEGARYGEPFVALAEREVLLCAGAYASPQLLLLSGVGDPGALARRGIAAVHDLPEVGRNLQDHLSVPAVWRTDEPVSLLVARSEPERCMRELLESGSGPLTSCIAEAGAFDRSAPDLPAPDLQLHAVPALYADEGLGDIEEHGLTLTVTVLQPRSRGRVTLASDDPTAKPRIEHAYLTEAADVQRTVAGMRRLLEIAGRPALGPYAQHPRAVPASDGERDILAHVRATAQTLYHPVGTCAIGAVVDTALRVRGIERLRVIDASVMPTIPRGNTNAPTIAIAERGAVLLRGATMREVVRSSSDGGEPTGIICSCREMASMTSASSASFSSRWSPSQRTRKLPVTPPSAWIVIPGRTSSPSSKPSRSMSNGARPIPWAVWVGFSRSCEFSAMANARRLAATFSMGVGMTV
jgi:choline dehydrogenase